MKNIHTMTRFETLKELAKHAHPSWYHSLLDWRTEQLKAILFYYQEGGTFPTKMVGPIYRESHIEKEAEHGFISRQAMIGLHDKILQAMKETPPSELGILVPKGHQLVIKKNGYYIQEMPRRTFLQVILGTGKSPVIRL